LVVAEGNFFERGELVYRLGERTQLVVGNDKRSERGESADSLGQRRQLVLVEVEPSERGEFTDSLGQRGQSQLREIQLRGPQPPSLLNPLLGDLLPCLLPAHVRLLPADNGNTSIADRSPKGNPACSPRDRKPP
jgi:hypothetical protein